MKLEVRILGLFSERFIRKNMTVDLPPEASLNDLFREADKKLGDRLFQSFVNKEKEPTILLNGRLLEIPKDLEEKLKDGDVLSVLSPVAGG